MGSIENAAVGKAKEIDANVKLMIMTAFELSSYELSRDLPFVKIEDLLKNPISMSSICNFIYKKIAS